MNGHPILNFDRPSRHGQMLGNAIAAIMAAGVNQAAAAAMCSTCAFRRGSMPNMSAATGLEALKSVLSEEDNGTFCCHHGLKDGEPTRLCAGFVIAQSAPWEAVKAVMERLESDLADMGGEDAVRARFDAWVAETDPTGALDAYGLARAYAALTEAQL